MKTATSNKLAVSPEGSFSVVNLAPSTLRANPAHTSAAMSLVDPDMPADVMTVGKLPWNDYASIEEGAYIRGEAIASVKRWEEDEETGEQRPKFSLVIRCTAPVKCSRLYKGAEESGPVRGDLVVEKAGGISKTYDVYTVETGTLVATTLRKIMLPLVAFTRGAEAIEIHIKVQARKAVKSNPKKSFWDMKFGAKPLGYERDNSIDYLSLQADFIKQSSGAEGRIDDLADIPFLDFYSPPNGGK